MIMDDFIGDGRCVTHHNACECRENYFKRLEAEKNEIIDENVRVLAENKRLQKRRGGECERCGSWVCPPLICMSCLAGENLESKLRKLNGDLTAENKRLRGLVKAAICPNALNGCKDGAMYDPYGQVVQCQWCDEVRQTLQVKDDTGKE
jgi:hypothetical protein